MTASDRASLIVRGGQLVNVFTEEIYPADVAVGGDRVLAVADGPELAAEYRGPQTEIVDADGAYLVPGLIDGHLHLECSKLSVTT